MKEPKGTIARTAGIAGMDLVGFIIALGTGMMPAEVRAAAPSTSSGREKKYGRQIFPSKAKNRRAQRRARGRAGRTEGREEG
jgi:hypothetical protein